LNDYIQNFLANTAYEYIHQTIQNEIIDLCNEILRKHIITLVDKTQFFVIAVESNNIYVAFIRSMIRAQNSNR